MNTHYLTSTPILNFNDAGVQKHLQEFGSSMSNPRAYLQTAHRYISTHIQPIYTVQDVQPVSITLQKGKGSCSQKMACLEAFARARDIPTRVEALWVDGRFWYPRFWWARAFIPRQILLAWSQFWLDSRWVNFDELFGHLSELAQKATDGFKNNSMTLFEAVATIPVDWHGTLQQCDCGYEKFNLSHFVCKTGGFFPTRDDMFAQYGLLYNTWRGRGFEWIWGNRKSV